MSLHQLNSKNKNLALLIKSILKHWNCFLSSVATDGKDGNGLQLEIIGPIFSSFDAMFSKSPKKLLWLALPNKIHWYLSHGFTGGLCVWFKALGNDFSTELT